MIDSTEADVIEGGARAVPGRAIVNSINLENGRKRIDAVVPLVEAHGAALIALTIDDLVGMAKTASVKLEVARKIHDIAVHEYGLDPDALIFDALTFTLATGDEEWFAARRWRRSRASAPSSASCRACSPRSASPTSPSGCSRTRATVLNSVFLHHCVEAGLDTGDRQPGAHHAVLRDPRDERRWPTTSSSTAAEGDDALAPSSSTSTKGAARRRRVGRPHRRMTPEEALHWKILHRKKDGVEDWIDAGVRESRRRPVLNEVLLPAMKEVGDKFGAGELILPFVLQSAEVMKKAVARLEKYLEKAEGYTKGKVVLATVYGDVHDIGKSLVNTILTNNGYTVFDLGKQVPVNTIIEKALEVGADAIGLSALLVSTSKQMPLCVQELHKRGLQIPVLIGGAAINRAGGSGRARAVRGRGELRPASRRVRVPAPPFGCVLLQGRMQFEGRLRAAAGRRLQRGVLPARLQRAGGRGDGRVREPPRAQELGIGEPRGLRYSWGYPACPDIEQHETLFRILPVKETIGVGLTSAWQLDPEQSTAALVVHHPAAKYFSPT
jgi:5-methyltetrahydrofolate--homocysteine methyltransferase